MPSPGTAQLPSSIIHGMSKTERILEEGMKGGGTFRLEGRAGICMEEGKQVQGPV